MNSTVAKKTKKRTEDSLWAKQEMQDFALKNNIKLPSKSRKTSIKFLDLLTILKIYYKEEKVIYYLLGFIPFLTIKRSGK